MAVVTARAGLAGDTDNVRELTKAQALTVREYAVQNFRLDDTLVQIIGLGKAQDAVAGGGPGRAAMRRSMKPSSVPRSRVYSCL
jgi:hypothetical protein